MILTQGVWLVDVKHQNFMEEHIVQRLHESALEYQETDHYGPPPKEWNQSLPKLWALTTVESLRDMPAWMREKFLPILMGGGYIYFLPLQKEGAKAPCPSGYYLRDQKEDFWIKIVFYFAT